VGQFLDFVEMKGCSGGAAKVEHPCSTFEAWIRKELLHAGDGSPVITRGSMDPSGCPEVGQGLFFFEVRRKASST
jgi:hypothetical protein